MFVIEISLPFFYICDPKLSGQKGGKAGGSDEELETGKEQEKSVLVSFLSPALVSLSLPPLLNPSFLSSQPSPSPSAAYTASVAAKNPTSAAFATAFGTELPFLEAATPATPAQTRWKAPRATTNGFRASSVSLLIAPMRDQSPE